MTSTKRTRGFSLLEILIAIFILAFASSVILSNVGGVREQAQKTVSRDNVRKVQEAYSQWLTDQPSIEYARSIFNPGAYSSDGASSVAASYPAPDQIETHLSPYLDPAFMADFRKDGQAEGRYVTDALERAGGYMTIFWNTNYRDESITVLITLP